MNKLVIFVIAIIPTMASLTMGEHIFSQSAATPMAGNNMTTGAMNMSQTANMTAGTEEGDDNAPKGIVSGGYLRPE